jgi:hypothetical protein
MKKDNKFITGLLNAISNIAEGSTFNVYNQEVLQKKIAERLAGQRSSQETIKEAETVADEIVRPSREELEENIKRGLRRAGFAKAPIATQSAELAQAGEELPENIDQYLPTIISLMESRGLQDIIPAQKSNPYNIFYPGTQTPVDYGSPDVAILGGGPKNKYGFMGIMREGGPYQEFRESGKLEDFFRKFTPSSDPNNPSNEELVRRYEKLRQYFD